MIWLQTAASFSDSMKAPNACCSLRNAGIGWLRGHDALGMRGFFKQHRDWGYARVPLDQRWHAPEQRHRLGIERPDLLADTRAVVVDPDRAAVVELAQRMPREMNLADALARQRPKVAASIEAVIAGAHEDVVDVAEDAAAGACRHRGDELP